MSITKRKNGLARLRNGAALVEYVTLVSLIGVLAIGSVVGLGQRLDRTFTDVAEAVASDMPSQGGGSPAESLPETAPPAGGGGIDVPEEAATACVDVNQPILSSVAAGTTTLQDAGIGDCVNIGWNTGMTGMDDPAIGLTAEPFFVNLGPTSLPVDPMGASVWTPDVNTMLTVSQPLAGQWYNVYPTGPLHLTIVGFQPGDLAISETSSQYVVTFPNDAVLFINHDMLETVKIGDAPREVFEVTPLDFSQPFAGPSLSIMGYNASTQGPNPPEQSYTNLLYDGSASDAYFAFEEMNNWNVTIQVDPIVDSSGQWTDFGHDGNGDFRMGYWEEPVSCSAAPDDLVITLRVIGETETMVIQSPVSFDLVPC